MLQKTGALKMYNRLRLSLNNCFDFNLEPSEPKKPSTIKLLDQSNVRTGIFLVLRCLYMILDENFVLSHCRIKVFEGEFKCDLPTGLIPFITVLRFPNKASKVKQNKNREMKSC